MENNSIDFTYNDRVKPDWLTSIYIHWGNQFHSVISGKTTSSFGVSEEPVASRPVLGYIINIQKLVEKRQNSNVTDIVTFNRLVNLSCFHTLKL